MNKVNILEAGIKKKIEFIQKKMTQQNHSDGELVTKIPEYLDLISNLRSENSNIKHELEKLRRDHDEDLEKIDQLLKQLSELMENNDA